MRQSNRHVICLKPYRRLVAELATKPRFFLIPCAVLVITKQFLLCNLSKTNKKNPKTAKSKSLSLIWALVT